MQKGVFVIPTIQDFKHAIFPRFASKVFTYFTGAQPILTGVTGIISYIKKYSKRLFICLLIIYLILIIYRYASDYKRLRELQKQNESILSNQHNDNSTPNSVKVNIGKDGISLDGVDSKDINEPRFLKFMETSASDYLNADEKTRQKLIEEGKRIGKKELEDYLENGKWQLTKPVKSTGLKRYLKERTYDERR